MLLSGYVHPPMKSTESKVPTETYLLPGQQHCIGLPWERPGLSNQPPPPPAAAAHAPSVNPFDKAELLADPCAGLEIGPCQVIRRLSSNSASSLLAATRSTCPPTRKSRWAARRWSSAWPRVIRV